MIVNWNDYVLKFHKEDVKYSSDVIDALEEQAKWAWQITDLVKDLEKRLTKIEIILIDHLGGNFIKPYGSDNYEHPK